MTHGKWSAESQRRPGLDKPPGQLRAKMLRPRRGET